MLVNGKKYMTIWTDKHNKDVVCAINQNKLPFGFEIVKLKSSGDVIDAIKNMVVRGAPLIGAAGAYSVYLALLEAKRKYKGAFDLNEYLSEKCELITSARPTAVNLRWAVDLILEKVTKQKTLQGKIDAALKMAEKICDDDVRACRNIGMYGRDVIKKISAKKKDGVVNVLTHCNAGWLAVIDYGTALAPVYLAKEAGLKVHVWVEETRPRNQGARLTAWELEQNGIDYSIITDNAGGYVMQNGMVDMVITGSDRTTLTGDVCNKIGTYKTALAAYDNKIPFYASVPMSSFDLSIRDGVKEIPIEERSTDEIMYSEYYDGRDIKKGLITFKTAKIRNFGFDVTPAKYVTGIITEKGIIKPNERSIRKLFRNG
ncbi:MAG: S-methyl-5-thioribose-1-phosphate isomerase [Ignavibacteriae bacterium]|nr:S-methyl-5-thioribose-1-phosphate isomerase [Ignavibacteriota bacterium]